MLSRRPAYSPFFFTSIFLCHSFLLHLFSFFSFPSASLWQLNWLRVEAFLLAFISIFLTLFFLFFSPALSRVSMIQGVTDIEYI